MSGGYLRHIQLTKQLEDKAKEAARNRQLAEEQIAMAQALLAGGKKVNADVGQGQGLVEEAQAALGAKDYKAALEKATMSVMTLREAYRERINAFIDSSGSLLGMAEKIGDPGEAKDALAAAREALGRGELEKALDLAKLSWKASEKVVHQHLSSSFSTAQNLILVSKNMGRDTSGPEDLLSRARSSLEKNNFDEAVAFTREGLDVLLLDLDGEVKARRAEVQSLLQNLESMGASTDRIKTLLERADGDIGNQQYDKAFASLKQARTEGEKLLQKGLEGSTTSMERPLKEAEEMGAEVAKARDLLRQAQALLKRGDSQEALSALAEFRKALDEAKFQRVLNTISQSKSKFVTARNLNLDTTAAVAYLNEAREALQKGNFTDALRSAQKGEQELDSLVSVYEAVDKEAKALEEEMAGAEAEGCDMGAARRFLEAARAEAIARRSDAAQEHIRRATEEVARARAEKTVEVVEEAQFLIALGHKMGLGLDDEATSLDGCQGFIRRKDYRTALTTASQAKNLLEAKITQYVSKRMENARAAAATVKVEEDRINGLLTKASTALGVKDFENALALTDEAFRIASAGLQESARTTHEGLRAGMELLKAMGKESRPVSDSSRRAEMAFSEGRFGEVASLAAPGLEVLLGQAEALFEGVKAQVIQVKNLNADIEGMKELLRAAKASLQAGEGVKALPPLRECWERAARALQAYQEAKDALAAGAVTAAEGKKQGVDMGQVVAMLLEGKKALEAGDFPRALSLGQQAKEAAERQGVLLEAQRAIMGAREQVELAAHLGVEVDAWRASLERAKEALKAKDPGEALTGAREVLEGVQKLIRDEVSTEVSRAATVAGEVQALGFDVRTFEDRIARAREALGRVDVRGAAELARAVIADMENLRGRFKASQEALDRLRRTMADLQGMGLDTSAAEKPLRKAEKLHSDGRYEDSVKLSSEALRELEGQREGMFFKTIGDFERLVAKAKGEGTNTRSAEAYLRKAKELVGRGQYKEAIGVAMQSEAELERMELQKDIAVKSLAAVKNKLSGVPLAAEVKALLVEAERAFNSGDFAKVLDLSLRAGDEFGRYADVYKDVQESMSALERVHEMASKMGAESARMEELISEARTLLERGAYAEARRAADQAREAGLGACNGRLGQLTSDIRGYLVLCSLVGASPGNAEEKLSMARAHLDKGDMENAYALLSDAKRLCEASLMARVTDALGSAKGAVAHARKIGADTAEAEACLEQAQEALEARHFDKAAMLAQKVSEMVESKRDVEKKFVDTTYEADSLIKSAKKFGIDAREAEKTLMRALELKRSDPAAAMEAAEEALAKAKSALDNFSPKVEATLEVNTPAQPSWQDAQLIVRNDGKALAKDLSVQVLGDVEVEGLKGLPILRAQGVERVPIRVKFTARGKIPIILKVKATRVLDGKEYEDEKIQEVEVGGREAAGSRKIQAEFDTRCLVCRGTIKKGFSAVECGCNTLFHEMCAKRSGKCPVCNRGFTLA